MTEKKSLLKNLIRTSKQTAVKLTAKDSIVDNRLCPHCKAPRPVGTDLKKCGYCGYIYRKD